MAGRRFCIVASVPAIGVPVEASSNLNARLGNVFVINTVPSKWPALIAPTSVTLHSHEPLCRCATPTT